MLHANGANNTFSPAPPSLRLSVGPGWNSGPEPAPPLPRPTLNEQQPLWPGNRARLGDPKVRSRRSSPRVTLNGRKRGSHFSIKTIILKNVSLSERTPAASLLHTEFVPRRVHVLVGSVGQALFGAFGPKPETDEVGLGQFRSLYFHPHIKASLKINSTLRVKII